MILLVLFAIFIFDFLAKCMFAFSNANSLRSRAVDSEMECDFRFFNFELLILELEFEFSIDSSVSLMRLDLLRRCFLLSSSFCRSSGCGSGSCLYCPISQFASTND